MTTQEVSSRPALRLQVAEVLREDKDAWLLVLRATLSLFITGWLAMRLQLPQPGTAMLTTVSVMHMQSGMVLAKSFYRTIGTLAGATAALIAVALFPQQPVPFLLAMALWAGLCAAVAMFYRNFAAYACVLSGYTAIVVALPGLEGPRDTFNSATARVAEVLLGVLVVGVISDSVYPTRMRDTLRKVARDKFANFMKLMRDSADGAIARDAMEKAYLSSVAEAVRFEDLRSSAIFEDAQTRARSRQLSVLNQHFMATSSSFHSLHLLMNRLRRAGRGQAVQALTTLYHPLTQALQIDAEGSASTELLAQGLQEVADRMPVHADELRASVTADEVDDFDTGASLMMRLLRELLTYVNDAVELQAPGARGSILERVRFRRGGDLFGAGIVMLRTVLAMCALSMFWIWSAWPSGSTAMLMATIYCALFASAPNPTRSVGQVLIGSVAGMAAAFVCQFFVLPQMDGYALFVAGVLPFYIAGPYLAARPKWATSGVGYCIAFVSMLAVKNPTVLDPVDFLNNALAQLIGMGAAAIAFAALPSMAGSLWFRRRRLARFRHQVALAAEAPLKDLLQRFESFNRDLLVQMEAQMPLDDEDSRRMLSQALAAHDAGRTMIELRQSMQADAVPAQIRRTTGQAVQSVAAFYKEPSAPNYLAAHEALVASIAQAKRELNQWPALARVLDQLHLLRMALLDGESAREVDVSARAVVVADRHGT